MQGNTLEVSVPIRDTKGPRGTVIVRVDTSDGLHFPTHIKFDGGVWREIDYDAAPDMTVTIDGESWTMRGRNTMTYTNTQTDLSFSILYNEVPY